MLAQKKPLQDFLTFCAKDSVVTSMTQAEIAAAYMQKITEAVQEQVTPGCAWPEPLRLPSPINLTEAIALRSWLEVLKEERGALPRIAWETRH